jgi:predicted nuclease of predicted toxin-antitoxin system
VKFLVDAQLPRKLAQLLESYGHDVRHTLDLADANRTSDSRINELSLIEQRVVITKDADFVDSFLLSNKPYKLLLVSTGNIPNLDLLNIFDGNLTAITSALSTCHFVEITRTQLIEHGG